MAVKTVLRQVYIRAQDEEALARRIDTFISALRLREGSVVAVERRRPFRGQELAVIRYEFPVWRRDQREPAMEDTPPPASRVRARAAQKALAS